jgi:hypothetical protein
MLELIIEILLAILAVAISVITFVFETKTKSSKAFLKRLTIAGKVSFILACILALLSIFNIFYGKALEHSKDAERIAFQKQKSKDIIDSVTQNVIKKVNSLASELGVNFTVDNGDLNEINQRAYQFDSSGQKAYVFRSSNTPELELSITVHREFAMTSVTADILKNEKAKEILISFHTKNVGSESVFNFGSNIYLVGKRNLTFYEEFGFSKEDTWSQKIIRPQESPMFAGLTMSVSIINYDTLYIVQRSSYTTSKKKRTLHFDVIKIYPSNKQMYLHKNSAEYNEVLAYFKIKYEETIPKIPAEYSPQNR